MAARKKRGKGGETTDPNAELESIIGRAHERARSDGSVRESVAKSLQEAAVTLGLGLESGALENAWQRDRDVHDVLVALIDAPKELVAKLAAKVRTFRAKERPEVMKKQMAALDKWNGQSPAQMAREVCCAIWHYTPASFYLPEPTARTIGDAELDELVNETVASVLASAPTTGAARLRAVMRALGVSGDEADNMTKQAARKS